MIAMTFVMERTAAPCPSRPRDATKTQTAGVIQMSGHSGYERSPAQILHENPESLGDAAAGGCNPLRYLQRACAQRPGWFLLRPARPSTGLAGPSDQERSITMTSFPAGPQSGQSRPATLSWIRATLSLFCAATALAALADFLFYRRAPGVSVAIFAAALCAATPVTNPVRARFPEICPG
jgi:hypothetical protein